MRKRSRNAALTVAIGVFVFSAYLLVTGSSVLTITLSESQGLQFGTIISWIGVIALPLAIYLFLVELSGSERSPVTPYRAVSKVLLGFGISWGVVGYALAGNWAFNFSDDVDTFRGSAEAAQVFWFLSFLAISLPVILFVVVMVHRILSRIETGRD